MTQGYTYKCEGKQCLIAETSHQRRKNRDSYILSFQGPHSPPSYLPVTSSICSTRNTVSSINSIAKTWWPSPVPRKIHVRGGGCLNTHERYSAGRYGNGEGLQNETERGTHRRDPQHIDGVGNILETKVRGPYPLQLSRYVHISLYTIISPASTRATSHLAPGLGRYIVVNRHVHPSN